MTAHSNQADDLLAEQRKEDVYAGADATLIEEVNLLRLEGWLFCFDPKKARQRHGVFTHEDGQGRRYELEFHPTYGQPSVLAYRVLDAIFTKLTSEGFPVADTISFSQRELARLVGRSGWGSKTSEQLYAAIQQLRRADIRCDFFEKSSPDESGPATNDTWRRIEFSLFPTTLFSGRGAVVQSCSVQLHPTLVASLNNRHWACFNWARLQLHEPIGRAIFKRLHRHFSNLYGATLTKLERQGRMTEFAVRRARKQLVFRKSYEDICRDWLGGLTPLTYASKIRQEQLGRHIEGLKRAGLIRKWALERQAQGDGFNLVFWPGRGFFNDYEAYYLSQWQPQLRFQQTSDERAIQQPLELVSHFYCTLHETTVIDADVFAEKEVQLAATLLEKHGYKAVKDLIAFALAQAKETRFDIQKFMAVKGYVNAWLATQDARARADEQRQLAAKKEHEAQLKRAYETALDAHLRRLKEEVGADQIAALWDEAERQVKNDPANQRLLKQGLSIGMGINIRHRSLLLERYPFPPFETWKAEQEQARHVGRPT